MISYDTSSSVFIGPDSKVQEANMGAIWGRQVPGGPHVCPMNLVIRGDLFQSTALYMNKHCFQWKIAIMLLTSNLMRSFLGFMTNILRAFIVV